MAETTNRDATLTGYYSVYNPISHEMHKRYRMLRDQRADILPAIFGNRSRMRCAAAFRKTPWTRAWQSAAEIQRKPPPASRTAMFMNMRRQDSPCSQAAPSRLPVQWSNVNRGRSERPQTPCNFAESPCGSRCRGARFEAAPLSAEPTRTPRAGRAFPRASGAGARVPPAPSCAQPA